MKLSEIKSQTIPIKIRFYSFDESPVIYNCKTDELSCIGNWMQCPLFIEKGKLNCKEYIKEFIENNVDIPLTLFTKQSSELIIDEVLQW